MKRHSAYIIIGILGIGAISAGWYLWSAGLSGTTTVVFDFSPAPTASSSDVSPVEQGAEPRQIPTGYLEYRSDTYHFSLFYPGNLSVKTFDEGGGASTITFQNVQTAEGFQMFIVPYNGTQISSERFKKDEPSGVRDNPQNITINGVPAVSFFSANLNLGDTAEVWFIRGGYLYEVTSLKPLAEWFSNIMQTWRFTQ